MFLRRTVVIDKLFLVTLFLRVDKLPSTFVHFRRMQDAARKIIASFTAMFVLQCGIYCACGTASASTSSSCHHVDSGDKADEREAGSSPLGHDSHHAHNGESHEKVPSGEAPSHHTSGHGGESCSHCQPSLTATEAGTNTAFASPSSELGVFDPVFISNLFHTVKILPCRFLFGLPPPVAGATLLGLHCALIT